MKMIWISVLFGLLNLLLTWFLRTQREGRAPSPFQVRVGNHFLAFAEKLKPVLVQNGCTPQGEFDARWESPDNPDTKPVVGDAEATGAGFPGGDLLVNTLIRTVVTPWALKKFPELPAADNSEKWNEFFKKQYDLSQS